jgi:hypothetical protein
MTQLQGRQRRSCGSTCRLLRPPCDVALMCHWTMRKRVESDSDFFALRATRRRVAAHINPPSRFGYTHSSVVNTLRSSILYSRGHFGFACDVRFSAFHTRD